jgi:hypothetical protein
MLFEGFYLFYLLNLSIGQAVLSGGILMASLGGFKCSLNIFPNPNPFLVGRDLLLLRPCCSYVRRFQV